jgi:cellulose synthase/poly-beta-1,6-N-acetylglucosamine synthase-like glycosyltransferase
VSIIVSTFNEENVIERKIKDISKLNYPANKMEILVYDDSSSDMTQMIAEKAIKESGLDGTVIRSVSRLGLNRSINVAVAKAKHNIVCITDSDVLLEKDALKNAVVVLKKFEHAGGVTGHILPVFEGEGVAQNTESSYRDFYHTSMLAESSIHSAFPGNGPLIVYDKSQVPSPIPLDYGSTDGEYSNEHYTKWL